MLPTEELRTFDPCRINRSQGQDASSAGFSGSIHRLLKAKWWGTKGAAGVRVQLQTEALAKHAAADHRGAAPGIPDLAGQPVRPRFGPTEGRYAARLDGWKALGVESQPSEIERNCLGGELLGSSDLALRHTDLSSSRAHRVKTLDDFVALQQTVDLRDKSCPNCDADGLVSVGAAQALRHASESGTLQRCAWLWRRDRLNSVCAEYERVCLTT